MRIAAFNSFCQRPEDAAIGKAVLAWLQTVAPNDMAEIARKFGVTSAFMRPIVESLVNQKLLSMSKNKRRNVYGPFKEPVDALEAVRNWKPLKANKEQLERYAALKAEREAFPSKHL